MSNIHKVKYGKTERVSFSNIKETIDIPYFIALQKDSYKNFLEKGIGEVLQDFSPVKDHAGRMELQFLDYYLDMNPKYSVKECKDRDTTYAVPLKVKVRLIKKNADGEPIAIDNEVFMGEFPLMTDSGSFIINGAERVIVSQLVRSPGVYTTAQKDRNGIDRFDTTVIPNRGAWLEFKQDSNNILYVVVDRKRKLPATTFIRALGFGTDEQIFELFGDNQMLKDTIEKDIARNVDDAKIELFKKLKSGEVPTIDGVTELINNMFFDSKRYDTQRVGRYKFNKKLSIATRIANQTAASDIVSEDGEIFVTKGEVISEEVAMNIQNAGINEVLLYNANGDGGVFKMIGNNTVDINAFVDCNAEELGINERVYYPVLKQMMQDYSGEALINAIKENAKELVVKHITMDDIIATMNINLAHASGFGEIDNIDHLANRRVRAVGELLQNQMRVGLVRLEKVIKERMSVTQDDNEQTAQSYINIKPVTSVIKEFFCSSQLSQFMDHLNPIAELTHKRKLSALGPGGLNRECAGFEVRDVHHSHYGRMCPIETPEGQNIGLISSLATYAKVNKYGFIEAPYRKVDKANGIVTDCVEYLQADEEDKYVVAQANVELNEDGSFKNKRVTCRIREDIREVDASRVDYMDVSPKQLVSVAASLIPFLENDDTSRALMGSNMQRQAVPLIKTEAPIIATGIEHRIAYDSGVCILSEIDGTVTYVDGEKVVITNDDGGRKEYYMRKFERSNQGTCINQRPIVSLGQKVNKGEIIADGPATSQGELALGKNILIGFMSWEGYNYEDAILISEDLVKDDVFTSVHIEEYEIESRDSKLGAEQITRDIPNLSDDMIKNLDEDGIIQIGSTVSSEDILVGKVTPKGETDLTPEDRLLRAMFGEKVRDVRDTSLRLPHGQKGIVVDVKVFTRANKDELSPGVNMKVVVYVAQKRKLGVGDKMAGRHGNKGVVSRVLPKEDMPFMEDGTPLQIVLNPLGVPSRMNIGQVLEVHLGYVAKMLNWKVETPVFDGASEDDIKKLFIENNLSPSGKIKLFDGRTGEAFENPVTVGYMYMLKLIHLVDDKIHARATGSYSLVTQQPLGGKAQFGGQRFGEMEIWALEAYGASHILQEILTVKSDDVEGRTNIYNSIVKGNAICEPGIPEAFKVLVREFRSLCLDVRTLNDNGDEISIDTYSSKGMNTPYVEPKELKEIDIIGGGNSELDIFGIDNDNSYNMDDFSFEDDDLLGFSINDNPTGDDGINAGELFDIASESNNDINAGDLFDIGIGNDDKE